MNIDLSELAMALSLDMHGIIEAIWGRAAIRRKQASHTYTATVLAFGPSWMR
jgi:hypothetical protein